MSRAWQANIPGFLFYGIIALFAFSSAVIKPFAQFLQNDEKVLWTINLIAEKVPHLFETFSEFEFIENYILAVFSVAFVPLLAWLICYQAITSRRTKSDNIAVVLGWYMYIPLVIVLVFMFLMALLMAVYFYPAI